MLQQIPSAKKPNLSPKEPYRPQQDSVTPICDFATQTDTRHDSFMYASRLARAWDVEDVMSHSINKSTCVSTRNKNVFNSFLVLFLFFQLCKLPVFPPPLILFQLHMYALSPSQWRCLSGARASATHLTYVDFFTDVPHVLQCVAACCSVLRWYASRVRLFTHTHTISTHIPTRFSAPSNIHICI